MLSLRSLDPLSGEVNSLATTAADSIVSRLLSEDSVAPSELSVLDMSLRTYPGFTASVSRFHCVLRAYYGCITYVTPGFTASVSLEDDEYDISLVYGRPRRGGWDARH